MKKRLSLLLVIVLTITLLGTFPVSAKTKKVSLSAKSVKVVKGMTQIIQLKNAPKNVKWKVADNKTVKISKKSGKKKNKITVKGRKAGKTKITATCAGKKYTVKVTVKKKTTEENATTKAPVEVTTKPVVEVTTEESTPEPTVEPTIPEMSEETNPEQPTEEVMPDGATTEGTETKVTTTGVTSEKTSIGETTIEVTSESITDEETTTSQRFVENYDNKDIVATAEKDKITPDEDLVIIFTLQNYQEGQLIGYGVAPKKVEKYVDGEWIRVPALVSGFIEPWYGVSGGEARHIASLRGYFPMEPGHYRWTHEVNWVDVSVEFDIIPRTSTEQGDPFENKDIVATVLNDKITVNEDLEIMFTLQNYQEGQLLGYGTAPKNLIIEKYVNEEWRIVSRYHFPAGWEWYEVSGGVATYSVNLDKYFDLEPAHYRWTHVVNGVDVAVEFDIILDENATWVDHFECKDIVASVTKDKITVDENLSIYFSLNSYQPGQWLTYRDAPKYFEKYVDGEWVLIPAVSDFSGQAYEEHGFLIYYTVKLNKYYDLDPGHYRWTQEINGVDVPVEFDIIEADTE